MGRELIAICDSLPGHFEEWLRLEFDMSRATAYNYMSVERHFGDVPEVVTALPSTTVYKLAAKSTPDALREAVVKEIASGAQVSPKDVERRISEAKDRAREDKRAELERREREQQHLNAEAKWQAKEATLRDAGADDSQIARERKKWDSTAAVKERVRQQESEDEQKRHEEYVSELERNKKFARELADLLGRSLSPDSFASLKAKARSLTVWSELRTILATN
jgi:Skp family chaperone for outer membrane proteins